MNLTVPPILGAMSVTAAAPSRSKTRDGLARALRRNGIPRDPDLNEPLPKRLLKSKLFWLTVVMMLVYVDPAGAALPAGRARSRGARRHPARPRHRGDPDRVKYAAVTAIPLSLLFLWADRFRPQRFWVWLMTFGWGACVATYVSAQINSWAAGHLSIIGDGDPATAARAAIYVAPFVEEASKATVLFWLAILMRYQWVSRLSGIVLAGLSGAAFAFTENVLYYGRVYRYAARTFGEVPPLEALQNIFVLRGLVTFFGHPLFTAMTGVGLAIALRSKSKIVRVVAPLAGYCLAVFLHMAFNTAASLMQGSNLLFIYLAVALPLVVGHDRLHRSPAVPRGPVDPGTAHRLRPARLAARKRSQGIVAAADPPSGAMACTLQGSRHIPCHHPACSARLPSWHICGMR